MPKHLDKPTIASSSTYGVTLNSRCPEGQVVISVLRPVIEEVFQITGETNEDRREVIETNFDAVWSAASDRYAKRTFARGEITGSSHTISIVLGVEDLVRRRMHIVGNAATRAAD